MRIVTSKHKICRRLGERCDLPKCPVAKSLNPPGQHGGKSHRAVSEFGKHLLEKQKVRFFYGLSETQFKKYFKKAEKKVGVTGDFLIQDLECRLDNVVYRLGFAPSRRAARQLVGHGHFLVNGIRVNIPSYRVKINDVIVIRPSSFKNKYFQALVENIKKHKSPSWISFNTQTLEAKISGLPTIEEVSLPYNLQLITEYYSK
jgi:small subunit ribosomal protein S4